MTETTVLLGVAQAVTDGDIGLGIALGALLFVLVRVVARGFYTVDQNERAVLSSFGRAHRLASTTLDGPLGQTLTADERQRYAYPQLEVIPPGGPYFRWPWQTVHKVSIATRTVNMAWDPESPTLNRNGTMLDAITKDQLLTGLTGQLRYRVSDQNLYAFLFGVHDPIVHVMGYFVSVLRQRIASFEAPATQPLADGAEHASNVAVPGVSINDLRKNLRAVNEHMDRECASSVARYGILLEASLITGIDPPNEVEAALAAINTAHNHVSAEVSLAQAAADQRIVESRRAVEIEALQAQAEVQPLRALAEQLRALREKGVDTLDAYVRTVKLSLVGRTKHAFVRRGGAR